MTTTEQRTTLDAVRALVPDITARVEEIEQARTLPRDLVDDLVAAGCFRALVPRSHGGDELAWADALAVIEELARADGSVGWTVMIGAAAPALLGHLPAATFDAVYASGPDVIGAGTFNPTGTATPVDGGFRVSGQWSFASGCRHAQWFLAHCIVDDGRMPPLRMMVLPAADVEIVDTWSTMGMRGTGSHDFTVDGKFVGDDWSFTVFEPPELDFTLMRIPELCLSTMAFAAVAVGIAGGAVEEIVALAAGKVPMFADADARRQPAVPQPTRSCRSGPASDACGAPPRRRGGMGDGRWPASSSTTRHGPGSAARRRGSSRRQPKSSTRRTGPVAARRSTTRARCNGGCATSTP